VRHSSTTAHQHSSTQHSSTQHSSTAAQQHSSTAAQQHSSAAAQQHISTAAHQHISTAAHQHSNNHPLHTINDHHTYSSIHSSPPLPSSSQIVEDYEHKDITNASESEKLYREWQLWTAAQIKDNLLALTVQETPPVPDRKMLNLISELNYVHDEAVQMAAVKLQMLLLNKFPDKAVVLEAANGIR
jgi:hypothetical protein